VLTAVVTRSGETIQVRLVSAESEAGHEFDPADCAYPPEESNPKECGPGPSPIIPEMKEIAWGAGSFIVFALLMRLFLFPRLKRGMDARYESIRSGHENAEATRTAARTEVSQYESALASAKAEAAKVIEAAPRLWRVSVRLRSPLPTAASPLSVTSLSPRRNLPARQLARRSSLRSPMSYRVPSRSQRARSPMRQRCHVPCPMQ